MKLLQACSAAFLISSALVLATPLAREGGPRRMPVQRLEANLNAFLEEHPDEAEAHYTLGRLMAFAFVADTTYVDAYAGSESDPVRFPSVGPASRQRVAKYERKFLEKDGVIAAYQLVPDAETALRYLTNGIRSLNRSIELEPGSGEKHLTLAYLLDHSRHLASHVDAAALLESRSGPVEGDLARELILASHDLGDADPATKALARKKLSENAEAGIDVLSRFRIRADPDSQDLLTELLERFWTRRSVQEYKRAFDLSIAADMRSATSRRYSRLVSHEAGTAILRLCSELVDFSPLGSDDVVVITRKLAELEAVPSRYPVSPIILPSARGQRLDDLTDPVKRVCFDLDGDGVVEDCSWIRPTTGLLVWDPDRSGRVESGRDLFGDATWWLLFSDGYRALDALDDDRDGWLAGDELRSLSVWYDLDSDGRSGAGEVIPIERTAIAGLATHWDAREGTALRASRGMRLRDGSVLATYDWFADCVQ